MICVEVFMGKIKRKVRKIKRRIALVVTLILILIAAAVFLLQHFGILKFEQGGGARDPKPVTEGTLEVHMIDVGQGDCILIRAPEGNMLIDTGDWYADTEVAIKTYLEDLDIRDFEYVVITHSDGDHIGAADYIMDNYAVDNVIMPTDDVRTTNAYKTMMTAIENNGAEILDAVPGSTYSIGEMEFKVLAPLGERYKDVNNYSVVIRVDFGESSFLFTGDAEADSEAEMVRLYTAADLDCDILKVGHHGSGTSSSRAFLDLVTPEAALISCGKDNKYGHPHNDVMIRLNIFAAGKIFSTHQLGDIVVVTDGEVIKKGDAVLVDESNNG